MNQKAVVLAGRINETQNGLTAKGVIPSQVISLCNEILTVMLSRSDANSWEEFQVEKMAGPPGQPIHVRGIALPSPGGFIQSHILIFLEEAQQPKGVSIEQIKDEFQLTEREQAVVRSLCKGLTNKEIAGDLGIAEQTVKEHVKNIMVQTRVTTRTGILAIALRALNGSSSNGTQDSGLNGKTFKGEKGTDQKSASEDLNRDRRDGTASKVASAA